MVSIVFKKIDSSLLSLNSGNGRKADYSETCALKLQDMSNVDTPPEGRSSVSSVSSASTVSTVHELSGLKAAGMRTRISLTDDDARDSWEGCDGPRISLDNHNQDRSLAVSQRAASDVLLSVETTCNRAGSGNVCIYANDAKKDIFLDIFLQ